MSSEYKHVKSFRGSEGEGIRICDLLPLLQELDQEAIVVLAGLDVDLRFTRISQCPSETGKKLAVLEIESY